MANFMLHIFYYQKKSFGEKKKEELQCKRVRAQVPPTDSPPPGPTQRPSLPWGMPRALPSPANLAVSSSVCTPMLPSFQHSPQCLLCCLGLKNSSHPLNSSAPAHRVRPRWWVLLHTQGARRAAGLEGFF